MSETTGEAAERADAAASARDEDGESGDADESLVGRGISRREDAALLRGEAEFTDDLRAPGMAHLALVRSECAHGDVVDVDTAEAAAREDVVAVFTWADVAASDAPGTLPLTTEPLDCDPPEHPLLARERVRYQGQPVAAVVAEDRYAAADAARTVNVTYDEREAVVDPVAATAESAPDLFEAAPNNVALTSELGDADATDEAFADADRVVSLDLENNRLMPTAMEPRAALARWSAGDERLTVEMTAQGPHGERRKFAHSLGLAEGDVRVVAPRVGGGFGHKNTPYPGDSLAGWAAMELGRPVKWTATRRGNYLAGNHGRDHRTHGEVAVDDDGTIRGFRVETHANAGGHGLGFGPAMPGSYGTLLAGQYDVPAIHCETTVAFTNTAPVHSYRGAGRPEAIYVTERLVDAAARELGTDPVELRRRNQLAPEDLPHETAVGASYDSGDYEATMDEALDAVDYAERTATERDDEGRYVGVGVACLVESSGFSFESGVVRVEPDGNVRVYAGTHSHGQGHETTYAQIVADELGVPYEDVAVGEGDTERIPQGTGTFASRSTITGGNAVAESARDVRGKARRVAAHLLDADPDALALDDGTFRVEGAPERTCEVAEVAEAAYGPGLPDHLSPGLEATTFYEPEGTTYPHGTHVAVVAVDPETGEIEILRYVAADDCGEQINPTIVEGQIHGGVAQGIGQARYEQTAYDEDGSLLTDSMRSYAVPRAGQIPEMETRATVSPSPRNDLGVKGVGEAGTIGAPPALVNAVADALEPLGVRHVDMPLTDERVWRAIRDAEQ
ncbi:xanthine dehydrogenase family protein molybdopterin-binding subunit [Halorussus gelatinilyticus]|uniref:Xanthine dehydrogenase family protein molybdopterin-binding subunit n=1 Tax=Halorussus gelatinilyticus TaxID=2937524 RepID=A0A8U0IHR3_9EURY|nr:xanthine dehydrogenase family protein molybdopterin-binding subunit [Halorussus gelatinilyticus]UPW00368.1 xanthine dehydrogenase family protein molybdopterin-binding subunit [Halorussus gelatinilyticus]